ncbi:MAG: hypothetical protein LBT99_01805 [Bifidobacteriaceae bacterium]|jgi:spoIIIJ-associated protein|nr:hypothetical protein [Bifidobacteriaceae bacterium]
MTDDAKIVKKNKPNKPNKPSGENKGDFIAKKEIIPTTEELNREADIAADFVEGILDSLNLDGDIEMVIRNNRVAIEIVTDSKETINRLAGQDYKALVALQTLTRAAVRKHTQKITKLIVDVAGIRRKHDETTLDQAKIALQNALDNGQEVQMKPMNSYKRKLVHDYIKEQGYVTRSRGAEPYRKLVIFPEKISK